MNDREQIQFPLANDEALSIARAIGTMGLTIVEHFEQKDRPADYYSKRRTNKPRPKNPFPSRRVVQRIRMMPIELEGEKGAVVDVPETKRPKVLSFEQFRVLYNAIASSSGWWPLADSRWNWRDYFASLEKYVMYLDDMPIGFGALERHFSAEQVGFAHKGGQTPATYERNESLEQRVGGQTPLMGKAEQVTRIVFVGIIPGMQGYRFGNYLFNFINHLAREGGTEVVVLSTAPEFDTMKGTGKPEQSAARMYTRAGFRLVQTDVVDARMMAMHARNLETLNLPAYYKNHPGFTQDALLRYLCEEFHCRRPYLPAKAKGR